MPEGKIIKALSGFYYVADNDQIIQCRGRGVFRKQKITPLVGDTVIYQAENPTDGYIMEIKERRNELGLTLLEIAERLNVKEATVQRYESGEIKNIKHETIVALSEILNCSPAYLMGWDDTPPMTEDSIIKLLKAEYDQNDQDIKFIQDYIKMAPNEREAFRSAIEAIKKIKDAD